MGKKNRMNNQPDNPLPNIAALNERITSGVQSHRVKIRLLTSVAFLFGFLAIATSILLVWCYLFLYLPKDKQLMRDAANFAAGQRSTEDAVKRIDNFLGAQILMTHVISMATTIVAIAVGVLGLGTLVLLTVVMLNRRATLSQINASLAQISNQLRELHSVRSAGPPRSG